METLELSTVLTEANDALRVSLERLGRVVVAFSGGADSSLLAYVATQVLGRDAVLCATAVSPSLPEDERAACADLAAAWDLRHVFVETHEMDNAAYAKNDLNRCYFCKDELVDVLSDLATAEQATVVLGVNMDDLGEHRPGQAAAAAKGAIFPLVEASLSKAVVRELSLSLSLSTWDKPAAACLASRVPHGTTVTVEILGQVGRAEQALRRLGFSNLRVRHYGDAARIELAVEDFPAVLSAREQIIDALKATGYRYVTLDLEGFRSGNLATTALQAQGDNRANNESGEISK